MYVIHSYGPIEPNKIFDLHDVHKIVHFQEIFNGDIMLWAEFYTAPSGYSPTQFVLIPDNMEYGPRSKHEASTIDRFGHIWHLMRLPKNSS
jgi:hypothetical protein